MFLPKKGSWIAILMFLILAKPAPAGTTPFDYNFDLEGFVRLSDPGFVARSKAIAQGDRLYVMRVFDGMIIQADYAPTARNALFGIDVSDPGNPRELFRVATGYNNTELFIKDHYAFIGTSRVSYIEQWTQIVDLNETTPTARNMYNLGGQIRAVQGNILVSYVSPNRLLIYDVTDPLNPKLLSALATGQPITTCTFIGQYLLTGWAVVDLTNPNLPTYTQPGSPYSYAAVLGTMGIRSGSTLQFDDLSKGAPIPWSGQYVIDNVRNVAVDGSLAYVTRTDANLYAADITDPGAPDFMKGVYRLPSSKGALAAYHGRAFVYDSDNHSVIIVRYTGEVPVFDVKPHDAAAIQVGSPIMIGMGQKVSFSVSMHNTGLSPWSGTLGYKLAILEDAGKLVTAPYPRINLPAGVAVAPGADYTFVVPIKGVATEGRYTIRMQMIHETVALFGPVVSVTVDVVNRNAAQHWMLFN